MAPHAVTKYIVHEDKLMELFKRCPVCTRSCEITKNVIGTLLQVKQSCSHCDYVHHWSSQPMVNNIPAGNLQLCAAVLFTGSSFVQISKVRQEQICNDRYFYITWLQVFHHIMLFFLVVHGCFQDPGHLRNNVPQTPVKTPFPYHLLAVETEPGTPNQRRLSWWGCDTGWWHARWLARWKFTWVLNCVTMTTLSIKTYWKIYIVFFKYVRTFCKVRELHNDGPHIKQGHWYSASPGKTLIDWKTVHSYSY